MQSWWWYYLLFCWECIERIFFMPWGFSLTNKMQWVAFRKLSQPHCNPGCCWEEECINLLVHCGYNLFQLHIWFFQLFVSVMDSSGLNLLHCVTHSFCLLLLLCWQQYLGEMFICKGIDLKVSTLEADCVLTAEGLGTEAEILLPFKPAGFSSKMPFLKVCS